MFLRVKTWKVDIETNSNRMTPKDHLAAGTTRKVVVLKDLSNKPYPSPVNLLITSIKSQKCFQKICQLHKMYLQKHIISISRDSRYREFPISKFKRIESRYRESIFWYEYFFSISTFYALKIRNWKFSISRVSLYSSICFWRYILWSWQIFWKHFWDFIEVINRFTGLG